MSQEPSMVMDWFEVLLKQLSSIRLSQSPKLRDKTAACREFKSRFFHLVSKDSVGIGDL